MGKVLTFPKTGHLGIGSIYGPSIIAEKFTETTQYLGFKTGLSLPTKYRDRTMKLKHHERV